MKKTIIGLIVLVVLLVLATKLFKAPPQPITDNNPPVTDNNPPPTGSDASLPAPVTMLGTFVCLPHRDTSGPQTQECAFGLKADNGNYYALDWSATPTSSSDLPMDRRFSVSGTLVPIEAISSDQWQKYNVKGIIKVTSHQEIASGIPSVPAGAVTLELNKPVTILGTGTTLKVVAILEDSRCPSDVQCIQAGRVRMILDAVTPSGTSNKELTIGDTLTTKTLEITLSDVKPYPISTRTKIDSDYRFTLIVKNR